MVEIKGKTYLTCRGFAMGLSAMLKKQGYEISKWYKGRVVWHATTGLELKIDIFTGDDELQNAVKIEYNKNSKFEKNIDMDEVLSFIKSLGLVAYMSNESIYVPYGKL